MPITIGSNISALKLVRQFAKSTSEIGTAFERLSSGQRINRAADDAAGLAVSESLKVNARISRRARANVGDGVSVLQIANGAINQISSLLTRMAQLSEQSANGTLGDEQRRALDQEYQALDKEIHRITASTEFNGLKLFDGARSRNNYTQITSSLADIGAFSPSADGQIITYYDGNSGTLRQLNLATNESTVITDQIASSSVVVASASGNTVVFESTSNITGQNAAGRNQLFAYDALTGAISQLTNSQVVGEGYNVTNAVTISADGSTVSFASLTNYQDGEGAGSAAGSRTHGGLYTMDIGSGVIRNIIPDVAGVPGAVRLSADGSQIAFASNSDYLGTNGDTNFEIYSANLNSSVINITQVTQTTGAPFAYTNGVSTYASYGIRNDGTVLFASELDYTGENAVAGSQIFRYDAVTGQISQLTSYQQGGESIFDFQLNVEGDRVFYTSNFDMLGDGSNQTGTAQLFEYDLLRDETIQTTQLLTTDFLGGVRLRTGDGNSLIHAVDTDPTGQNGDGSVELFMLDVGLDAFRLDIEVGDGAAGSIITEIASVLSNLRGLGGLAISSREGAYGGLRASTENIDRLGGLQGVLGAGLSRLEAANRVLSAKEVQQLAAASRITDADIAGESANLVRNQILQQAAAAVLAQASNQPAIAAQLLSI